MHSQTEEVTHETVMSVGGLENEQLKIALDTRFLAYTAVIFSISVKKPTIPLPFYDDY